MAGTSGADADRQRDDDTVQRETFIRIQRAVFPDPQVFAERALFFRCVGLVEWNDRGVVHLGKGATLSLEGYHNLLPAYLIDCDQRSMLAVIGGDGCVRVDVHRLDSDGSAPVIVSADVTLRPGNDCVVPLGDAVDGVLFLAICSKEGARVDAIDFAITGRAPRTVTIAGCITTFRREAALSTTLARINSYLATNRDLASHFEVLVVDNGGTVPALPYPWARLIANPNWGGAGGFARALLVFSTEPRPTHALFMDDDARFFPDVIRRTWAILAYGREPDVAVSGALIIAREPTVMFENGARFCDRPLRIDSGADLADRRAVAALSRQISTPGDHRYGAWWYFCFPLSQVRVWPFPFFVRGDDIHFSLANRFRVVNPVGIAVIQDCFDHRATPLSVYCDTRQQVMQMLLFFDPPAAHATIARSIRANFNRYNASYHYATAAAIALALTDVVQGPPFWEAHLGLKARRRRLGTVECPRLLDGEVGKAPPTQPIRLPFAITRWVRRFTFNGHLLPRWFLKRGPAVVSLATRGNPHVAFMHHALITADAETGLGYICQRDRLRFFANRRQFMRAQRALLRRLGSLMESYREPSHALASQQAWARRFAGQSMPRVLVDAKLEQREPSGVRCYGLGLAAMLDHAGCQTSRLRDPGQQGSRFLHARKLFAPTRRLPAMMGADVHAEGVFHTAQRRFHALGRMTELEQENPPDVMWWTYPLPLRLVGAINIYTVHDCIPLTDRAISPVSGPRLARVLRLIERTADHVVTVSHASRAALLSTLGWRPDFVSVLYQPSLLTMPGVIDRDLRNAAFAPLVCIATLEPRKNIARLLAAYRASGTRRPLVLCGAMGWHGDAILRQIHDCPGAHWAGVVPDHDLAALLNGARALILPSLAEGFGRPLVEAMQFGLPIIASSLPSSHEIAGDCALFFAAPDVEALAHSIALLDVDDGLAQALGQKAQSRFDRMFCRDILARDYRRLVTDLGLG